MQEGLDLCNCHWVLPFPLRAYVHTSLQTGVACMLALQVPCSPRRDNSSSGSNDRKA